MMEWLQGLSGGAATAVGSATGAAIGLIALMLGALFNAWLNRRRDDRLQRAEKFGLAVTLLAELSGFERALIQNIGGLQGHDGGALVPDLAQTSRLMETMLPKLWLLDGETIQKTMDAYVMVEQHTETLVSMGGIINTVVPGRQRVLVPPELLKEVIAVNENTLSYIRPALARLNTLVDEGK